MSSTDEYPISRGKLLRYGAGGAAFAALGSFPVVADAASDVRAATPKRGGTLKFARSIAPTQLDPANSIIAGDVYTLDKIFEPLYITIAGRASSRRGSRPATRVSKDKKTFTFNLRPGVKFSDGKPLTAADVVFSINRARTNKKGPLSFLDFAIKTLEAKGTRDGRRAPLRAVGAVRLRHLRLLERDHAGELRRQEPRRRSSPTRSAPGRSCSPGVHAERRPR